jgi:hypothetical protein
MWLQERVMDCDGDGFTDSPNVIRAYSAYDRNGAPIERIED